MKSYGIAVIVMASAFLLIVGCNGGGGNPSTPDLLNNPLSQGESKDSNRRLLGLWEVRVSADRLSAQVTPLRSSDMHLNLTYFLETMCSDCIWVGNFNVYSPTDFSADIKLKHPFPDAQEYTGFDVRGIVITDANYTFPESGRMIAWGNEYMRVMNPSGYTDLFNPTEYKNFAGGNPVLNYYQGILANPGNFTATLNPFLSYGRQNERRMFLSGADETRRIRINAPASGELVFGYAVDGCWAEVADVTDPANDFPEDANCLEAYRIDVDLEKWPLVGESSSISVRVFDHQGPETIQSVTLEAPGMFAGAILMNSDSIDEESAVFSASLPNDLGAAEEDVPLLIRVVDQDVDENLGAIDAWLVYMGDISNVADYKEIGPEGGELSVPGATLTIPAGALEESHTVYLEKLGYPNEAPGAVSDQYTFGSDSDKFIRLNTTLILEIDTVGLPEGQTPSAGLAIIDTWIPIPAETGAEPDQVLVNLNCLPPLPDRQGEAGIDDAIKAGKFIVTVFGVPSLWTYKGSSKYFSIYSSLSLSPQDVQNAGQTADKSFEFLVQNTDAEDNELNLTPPFPYLLFFEPPIFNYLRPYAIVITDLGNEPDSASWFYPGIISIDDSHSYADLQETITHEFFHQIQYSYWTLIFTPAKPLWVVEGTAAMVGGWGRQYIIDNEPGHPTNEILDDNHFLLNTIDYPLAYYFGRYERLASGLITNEKPFYYDSQAFYCFLTRQCGVDFMQTFLQRLSTNPLDSPAALGKSIKDYKPTWELRDAFLTLHPTDQKWKGYMQDLGEDGVLGDLGDNGEYYLDPSGNENVWGSTPNGSIEAAPKALGDWFSRINLNLGPGRYEFSVTPSDGKSGFEDPAEIGGYWCVYDPGVKRSGTNNEFEITRDTIGLYQRDRIPSTGKFSVDTTVDGMHLVICFVNTNTILQRFLSISCQYESGGGCIEPPAVNITNCPPNGTSSYTFTWTMSDDCTPVSALQVAYSKDGGLWQTLPDGTQSYSWASIPSGNHTFRVRVIDTEGNPGLSNICSFTGASGCLSPPTVQITNCPGNCISSHDFNWTMFDDCTPSSSLQVQYKQDAGAWITLGNGAQSYNWTPIPPGNHTFQVRVTDGDGNTSYSNICSFSASKIQFMGYMNVGLALMDGDTIGNYVYSTSGQLSTGALYTWIRKYDPQSNSWTYPTTVLQPRKFHQVVALGSRIYSIGGYSGGGLNSVEYYDTVSQAKANVASMIHPRYYHASATYNGKIYVFGGVYDGNWEYSCEVYDPTIGPLGTWSEIASLPTSFGLQGEPCAVVAGSKIYVLLGGGPGVRVYDPAANSWEYKWVSGAPGLDNQESGEAWTMNGYIYAILPDRQIVRYDPISNTLENLCGYNEFNCPTPYYSAGAFVNGKFYYWGNFDSSYDRTVVEVGI